jgi:hypothetical protein
MTSLMIFRVTTGGTMIINVLAIAQASIEIPSTG